MNRVLSLPALAFAGAMALTIPSLAADTQLESTRIPLGRGQYIITQLPRAAQPEAAPYALTGQTAPQTHHAVVRLGIRGETIVVPG